MIVYSLCVTIVCYDLSFIFPCGSVVENEFTGRMSLTQQVKGGIVTMLVLRRQLTGWIGALLFFVVMGADGASTLWREKFDSVLDVLTAKELAGEEIRFTNWGEVCLCISFTTLSRRSIMLPAMNGSCLEALFTSFAFSTFQVGLIPAMRLGSRRKRRK